jgi:hypothetical protein
VTGVQTCALPISLFSPPISQVKAHELTAQPLSRTAIVSDSVRTVGTSNQERQTECVCADLIRAVMPPPSRLAESVNQPVTRIDELPVSMRAESEDPVRTASEG